MPHVTDLSFGGSSTRNGSVLRRLDPPRPQLSLVYIVFGANPASTEISTQHHNELPTTLAVAYSTSDGKRFPSISIVYR